MYTGQHACTYVHVYAHTHTVMNLKRILCLLKEKQIFFCFFYLYFLKTLNVQDLCHVISISFEALEVLKIFRSELP